jgi:hypothetical protein
MTGLRPKPPGQLLLIQDFSNLRAEHFDRKRFPKEFDVVFQNAKGEFCSRMASPACDRAIEYGMGPALDRAGYLAEFKQGCREDDGSCSEKAPNSEAEAMLEDYIKLCTADFPTFSCTSYAAGEVPDGCMYANASPMVTPASGYNLGRTLKPWK